MNLTKKQIESMSAGREMDALVAEHVMGWEKVKLASEEVQCLFSQSKVYIGCPVIYIDDDEEEDVEDFDVMENICLVPEYSTNITDAWEVFQTLGKNWCELTKNHAYDGYKETWSINVDIQQIGIFNDPSPTATEDTAPLAICKAALFLKLK